MISITFVLVILQTNALALKNLAFNKSTLSSRNYYPDQGSWTAVDGILSSVNGSCFHAGYRGGWMVVDLEGMFRTRQVIVYGYGADMKSLEVRVSAVFSAGSPEECEACTCRRKATREDEKSEETGQETEQDDDYNDADYFKETSKVIFTCDNQFEASRFVILGPHMRGDFFICEVEVYGRDLENIGCFEYVISSYDKTNSSIASCLQRCNNLSTSFAALQNGSTCLCVDHVYDQTKRKRCNSKFGYPSMPCGGLSAYSVYAVCPSGYYGKFCSQTCHCQDNTPCSRSGTCFNSCQQGWSGDHCNRMDDDLGRFDYVGCFEPAQGTEKHMLRGQGHCAEFCNAGDFTYFAIVGMICHCTDEIAHHQTKNVCDSDGGMSLYRVCSPGSYGDFCLETCHCSSGYCSKTDGMCLRGSECLPGWKGTSCNVRDCSVNNGGCSENSQCYDDDGVAVCLCKEGFENELLWKCEDTDECAIDNGGCNSVVTNCSNTIGSFECICQEDGLVYNYTSNICQFTKANDSEATLDSNHVLEGHKEEHWVFPAVVYYAIATSIAIVILGIILTTIYIKTYFFTL